MSQVGTTQTLRDRIEARRAALAQTAGAAPEPSLRDRIAARRAALGGTAQPAARQTPGTLTGSVSGYEQPTGAGAFQRPAMAQPEPSQGIIENFGIGLAQRIPIAAADVLNLVRGGFEASNDPAAAVLPAVGNTLDMVSPGLQGAGGDLANQTVNTLAAPPRSPMLNAVSGALGERTDVLRTIGNAPVAAYDAATGGTPSPFSGAGIARAAGGTVIDMGASMGGGFVGGVVGGPAGAAAGAFAPNMLSQWASGMAETANRIMEANPEMDQREALARAFGVSGTAAVPAAMLDSLTGAEGAVAKIGTNTLGRTIRQGVVTGAKAVVKEAATEPGQSVIQHFGSLAAQPIVGQLPNDAVEQYAKERAAEALIGGLMGGAGGGASVVMDRMGGSNGRNGDPTQGRNVAGRGPVGRAPSGVESPAAQQQQVRGVAPGVPGMVGPQGAPAGTQPGDVAGERSVPLMADLAGDWERQAQADAEKGAAYTERLWDELAPQEQVAAEKADPSVMPGATDQQAATSVAAMPRMPNALDSSALPLGTPDTESPQSPETALAQEQAQTDARTGDTPSTREQLSESVPLQNDSGPSGRQLSPDGMSNLRRKMIARREMLRASSQARQMQAEQDATIGRQVAPVDRSAADAIAEGYSTPFPNQSAISPQTSREEAPKKPQTVAESLRAQAAELDARADALSNNASRRFDNAPGAAVTGGSGRVRSGLQKKTNQAIEGSLNDIRKAKELKARASELRAKADRNDPAKIAQEQERKDAREKAIGATKAAESAERKAAPLVNIDTPDKVRMTKAEWAKTHSDYKAVSVRGGVRVRTVIRGGSLSEVFITDAPATKPTPAPTPETSREEAPKKPQTVADIARFGVYGPVTVKGRGEMYAVRESADGRGFGDTLHSSRQEAEKYASEAKARDEQRAKAKVESDAKEAAKAAKDAEANRVRSDLGGFGDDKSPLVKGKIVKSLDALARVNGEVATVRDHVRKLVESGAEVGQREENKIKPMTRTASNRADQRQQDAHARKVAQGGKITVYMVGGYDLGKYGHDFAKHLIDQKAKPTPNSPAIPDSSPKAAKEPWEMTRAEYAERQAAIPASGGFAANANRKIAKAMHRKYVGDAVAEGKPVPSSVLAEYPDLNTAKPAATKPTPSSPGIPDNSPNSPAIPDSSPKAAKEPWEMTQQEYTGPYKEPVTAEDIRRAEKTSTASRKKFESNTNKGGWVPPPIKAEIGAKIAAKEATVDEMREAYRAYAADYREKAERHYAAVASAVKEGKPVPASVLADYPDLANRSETQKSSPKSEPALEGAGATDSRKGMAIIAERVRPHLQMFDNAGDMKQQLRGMMMQWVNGGKTPPRTAGTKNGAPFSAQQTRQPLELAAKLANETGRVHSVVQIVDDSDKVLGQAVIEAPQIDGENESLTNPQVFAWDRLLGGAVHIWPGYRVGERNTLERVTRPKTELPPVASMDRAALLAELGEKVTGTVKKLRETVEARRRQTQTPSAPAVASTTSSTPQADAKPARTARVRQEKNKGAEAATAPDTRESESPSPKGTAPTEPVKKASTDTDKARATLAPKQQALSDKLGAERKTLEAMGNVPAEHKAQVVTVEEAAKRAPAAAAVVDARNVSSGAPETKGEIGDRTRKLRDFIREVPEFALDPHFIVAKVQDGRAVLRFQDGGRYSFAADAIGISFEVPPTVGQRVEIDLKAVKSMKHGESWIIAEPTGKAPSAAVKTEMAQRAGIDAADVGTEGTTSTAKKLIGWANQTEADARAKLRDKAKKQKGKMSSGIDPIEQAETAYQIGRWAAALVVRGGVKVAQAVYQIVGKVGPVQLRTRRAAEAITNQIIEAAGKNPTEAALTIAAGDVEAKHLDAQAATAERLAKAAETEIAAGTDPQGRAKVAAEYRAQAAQLREQADAVRKSPKPEAKPKEAKPDTRPASVKVSRQRAVLNVAAIVAFDAGKALKSGTKVGNKRLGAMVDKALVRVPWMKGDREAIVRSARAILKDAGKDPAKIEAAHAAAAEELSKRATAIREAKRARGALVADMFKDSPDAKISGRQAMKERMREVGKTVGKMATAAGRTVIKAIRQTKQAGRAEAAAKIADLRERIKGERKRQADMRRIETRGAVDAAKDAARDQAAMQQGFRDELVRLIRENMPRELRGKYLTAVRDVKTLARLGMEAGKLERDLLAYNARKGIKEAENAAGTAGTRMELEPELRKELDRAMGALTRLKKRLRGAENKTANLLGSAGATSSLKTDRLTTEDLREIIDEINAAAKAIESIRFQQKNMDRVRIKGELVAAAGIREQMGMALASAKDLPAGADTKTREAGYLLRKLRRRLNWDSLTVMLDGGKASGPFRQLFNAVRKGREEALRLHHEFQDKIGTIVTGYGYDSTGRMLVETSGVLGEALQKTVKANIGGEPREMTLGQAMYLYAASSDTGFLARIRKGQKIQFTTQRTSEPESITEDDLASVAAALTAKQRALVDELKAAYDQHYFQKLSTVNKRLKGVFLDKVEGYWGIKLNRTMSEMRGVPTDWRGNYIAALEEAGYMQEREGPSKTPILIGDFGHDIITRSKSAASTIAKAEATKLQMQTILHPDTVQAITAKYGKQTIDQLTRRIAEWSGGTKYSTTGQVWKELMQMWSRAKTQLRFPTWLRNAAGGSSRMLAEMGVVDVASKAYRPNPAAYRELMQFSPIARERWAGGSAGNFYDTAGEDFADESLKDASVATMRNLAETAKGLMTLDADRAKVGGAGMWKSWKKTLDAITIGNYFDAHGAVVAYRVFLEKAPKDWPEAKRKKWAAGKSMRLFERTANTAKIEFANDVQLDARENMLVGMMTAFTGDTAKAMNMVYQAQARARSGEITWGRAMRTIMALLVGSALSAAIAAAWAAALGKGYDRAKSAAANRFIQEVVSVIPGGGMATNAVQKVLLGIQSDSVLDVPMMDVLNSIKITTAELAKAMDAPTRKVRKTTVTASERYVRALMQGTRVADLAGIPSQYIFDAKAAIDNWGR